MKEHLREIKKNLGYIHKLAPSYPALSFVNMLLWRVSPFISMILSAKIIDMILDSFGVQGEHRHIINGHVPVRAIKGEKPVKANGKLLVIDGGFSKAYQPKTGTAGYTLTYHSRGFDLVQHQPFHSAEEAIRNGDDIKSSTQIVEMNSKRMLVKDTDKGRSIQTKIDNLKKLLYAYRKGFIKELTK